MLRQESLFIFLTCGLCLIALTHTQQLIPAGSQQLYELVNKVRVSDLRGATNSAEETSYTLQTQLKFNSVWHSAHAQLLQVYFSDATVSAPAKGSSAGKGQKLITQHINKLPDRPFYISLVSGKPQKVIAHTSRDQSLLNLERGIASLLQLQYKRGAINELDVSGQCNVLYNVMSSTRITKTKNDCSHWDLRVNYRVEKPLSVAQHSEEQLQYDLSAEGSLLTVKSVEKHRFALQAKPDAGSQIESQLLLKHKALGAEQVPQLQFEHLEDAIKSLLEWYRVFDIEADVDGAINEFKNENLKQRISAHAQQLQDEHIGKETLALIFAQLLPLARITKQQEFVEILQEQEDLQAQLVDLLGAAQTIDAHNAIHEVFDYAQNQHANLLEKYFQSLAVGTHPERAIVEQLWQRIQQESQQPIKNKKLRDTIIQTLATLTHQLAAEENDELAQSIRKYLLQQLQEECNEKDAACKTLYLRALQNLQHSSNIDVLLTHALLGEVKVSVAAMQALQSFPIVNFKEGHRKIFAQIFYQLQRKYDSSARDLALDILFAMRPSKQQLCDLLDYLASNDHHFEVKTYVIQKLRMLAEKCARFRTLLAACLSERPWINNYHVIAQKGLTTVLTRHLSQAPAVNESLLSVQEIYQGVLKRGSVELILKAAGEETSTFKLGIYTSGLSSFVGDSDDVQEDDISDDSPATAGMEISVQGVLLRPLIFFSGQSELMGHVWSGTASDPTPAFQATMLTQDHEHYVILSSGATAYNRIIGAKSVDLNGKVELSIWNRNANTEIEQNTGAGIHGVTVAGFTYARLENQFTLSDEPRISLQADIDFYSGIKLCMQLQRPENVLTHANTRLVSLLADKPYTKKVGTKRTHKSPGQTLALNQKNNEMCNMIFS